MRRLAPLPLVLALAACGGGSSGTSAPAAPAVPATAAPTVPPSAPPVNPTAPPTSPPTPPPTAPPTPPPTAAPTPPPTAAPTPPPTAAPTPPPTAAPTPPPTPPPTAAPTPAPGNAAAPVFSLDDSPTTAYGDTSNNALFATTGTSSSAAMGSVQCYHTMATQTHYHARLTIYVNGRELAVPPTIGMYRPQLQQSPYYYDDNASDPASCDYDLHTHAAQGVIHIESPAVNASYTLGQLFDLWGQTYGATGFGSYSGAVRLFDTDEHTGAAGSHPVVELTGTDPHTVTMRPYHDYTIEVGAPYVATPSDNFNAF